MAGRDRLAAMRAQQAGNRYNDQENYTPQPAAGDYNRRANNPYAQQDDDNRYEMRPLNGQSRGPANAGGDDLNAFYDEISSIQDSIAQFNSNVQRISDLHSRSLNTMDDQAAAKNNQQLDSLVEETSSLSNQLKMRVKDLERKAGGRDANAKRQQTGAIKQRFLEAIQNYQNVERQYRTKYKQRMERQFKIVKPNATPEEIRAVVNDDQQGGQIFSQALMSSTSFGESRAAYREVQERHEDIKRIERTLTELAQLFNDMSILVEQQDETINAIETTAGTVEKDVEQGLQHADKAVVSARAARKKRWICFAIIIVILAIIAIVLAIHFAGAKK